LQDVENKRFNFNFERNLLRAARDDGLTWLGGCFLTQGASWKWNAKTRLFGSVNKKC
jgi:hypothetical protein